MRIVEVIAVRQRAVVEHRQRCGETPGLPKQTRIGLAALLLHVREHRVGVIHATACQADADGIEEP